MNNFEVLSARTGIRVVIIDTSTSEPMIIDKTPPAAPPGTTTGAPVPDLMETSGWQQPSVRGFLAGTVKKKLGFSLRSQAVRRKRRTREGPMRHHWICPP